MFSEINRLMLRGSFSGRLSGPEEITSVDVATYLRAATLEDRLRAVWTCIPHEVAGVSRASPIFKQMQGRYAKQAAMGLITGSCDFVFTWDTGSGWIELKSKTGSLSQPQKDFRKWCEVSGVRHAVCRSRDEVIETLRKWGVLDGSNL